MAVNNRVKITNDIELKDRLVAINRVTKVTKGGRTFSFSAIVVVGNEDGIIGWGLGKAGEVTAAIAKGVEAAKKNLTRVPVLKGTVPHEQSAKFGGADEPMLTEIPSESVVGESTIDVQEDAYIFATYESTTVDSMTEEISDGRTKSFTKVSHGYTLDLGYCTAGTHVRIKNSNEERVNITAYALNLDAADTAYQTLNEQTMEMTSFSDTKITGTIDVKKEGRLIFAVADDAGWKLYVDGEQTDPEVFGEAFISTYLTEGTHTVELRYQTPGFMVGAGVSLACILIVILIAWIKRHH